MTKRRERVRAVPPQAAPPAPNRFATPKDAPARPFDCSTGGRRPAAPTAHITDSKPAIRSRLSRRGPRTGHHRLWQAVHMPPDCELLCSRAVRRNFERPADRLARADAAFIIRHERLQLSDDTPRINECQAQRQQRVLHPETGAFGPWEHEQHRDIARSCRTTRQAPPTQRRSFGHFGLQGERAHVEHQPIRSQDGPAPAIIIAATIARQAAARKVESMRE